MGRKSRLKRERREMVDHGQLSALFNTKATQGKPNNTSLQIIDRLCDLFRKYNAEDVAIALISSDLWLPNIASQVKHQFLFRLLCSLRYEEFNNENRIADFECLCRFLEEVFEATPDFSLLEDYVPEADWGEIRAESNRRYPKIFYGGMVERVTDFIKSFRLYFWNNQSAIQDIEYVLELQNAVISAIPRTIVGDASSLSPGHIELPSEEFWQACLQVSSKASSDIQGTLSSAIATKLGSLVKPKSLDEFGDSVFIGESLPFVTLEINNRLYPLSLRNAASVVLDYWREHDKRNKSVQSHDLSIGVSRFLSERIPSSIGTFGSYRLATHREVIPYPFSGAIISDGHIYLIAIVSEENINGIKKMENEVHRIITGGEEWALKNDYGSDALYFASRDGAQPKWESIEIIVVISGVTTAPRMLAIPNTRIHVWPLPDFVTVFDSLNDIDELNKFFEYINSHKASLSPMSMGISDIFASFRDSHAVLVGGAISPTLICLDPHWGSNWRFTELSTFWEAAPPLFPNETTAWRVQATGEQPHSMDAKASPTLSWWATIGKCVVHAVFPILGQELDSLNGRLLEQFVQCLADSAAQRCAIIEDAELFNRERIVINCFANPTCRATDEADQTLESKAGLPLFDRWRLDNPGSPSLIFSVQVNLARLLDRLTGPLDASFEVECILEATMAMSALEGVEIPPGAIEALEATSSRRPRFTVKAMHRIVDAPEFVSPETPSPEHYKLARQELALVFRDIGVSPGRYELSEAKEIIDPARDLLRSRIHSDVATFGREALTIICIRQLDALAVAFDHKVSQLRMSLEHEVSFDRSSAYASAHEQFTKDSRNYRYLLEVCLSEMQSGVSTPDFQTVKQIVARVDWLFVLYGVSDTIHNDIDVAGVEIDHEFIPEVFFSEARKEREGEFSRELAALRLGIDVTSEDRIDQIHEASSDWIELDKAFSSDVGFSFSHFLAALLTLARWPSITGIGGLSLSYRASRDEIEAVLLETIEGITTSEVGRIIDFAILDNRRIRYLLGKHKEEGDVPVWEHNKRDYRYTIRPLVLDVDGSLVWGAAAAERAARIWRGSILEGYLPAEFSWSLVRPIVRGIKESLEHGLEEKAFEICSRRAVWTVQGIDFRNSFPKEGFDDVGDFDVLAYWPDTNHWLAIECKYNQPPFCLKDARRLRDRIFGVGTERGQFAKIERRRAFLETHHYRLRELLAWPEPTNNVAQIVTELYVSREIYWWMRNPPYSVPTHFVRIDTLDRWLEVHLG